MKNIIRVLDRPVQVLDIAEGWAFPDPRSLLKNPEKSYRAWKLSNLSSYQIGQDEVLVFMGGERDYSKPEIEEEVELSRFEVKGYGPHLHRIVYQTPPESPLRAGVTVNVSGWSSFPPHGFERDGKHPAGFMEIFYFMIAKDSDHWEGPAQGILLSGTFGRPWVRIVRDGLSLIIYPGLHAVTAMPGCKIGYIWAYTADELPDKTIDGKAGRYREDV